MTILKEVLAELLGMFLGDARLAAAVLAVVAVSAGLIKLSKFDPITGGVVLLAGCLAVVVEGVHHAARQERGRRFDEGPEL